MIKRKTLVGLAAAAAFAATVPFAQPASAAPAMEYNVASSDSTLGCGEVSGETSISGVCGSFLPDGDYFWVRDTRSDGHSAAISWQNYDSAGHLLRQGACGQTDGIGQAGYCNKNVSENTDIKYRACTMEWSTKTLVSCGSWFWRSA